MGGAVHVVELTGLERPQERGKAEEAEKQRRRNQPQQHGHDSFPRLSLKALEITATDDADMATAAISGVTNPAMAIGMVSTL